MARDISGDVQSQVNALVARDPQLQALLTQAVGGNAGARKQFEARLASLGFQMDKDYHIDWNDQDYQTDTRSGNARIDIDRDNWLRRNADWAVPVGVGAATLGFGLAGMGPASGLFGGGGGAFNAAGTGATAGGYGGASAAGGSSLGGGLAAAGGSVAGSTVTTGGTLAGLSARDWLTAGGIGSATLGQWWAQRQADKADGRAVDMSREALALEKEMFERELVEREKDRAEDLRRYENDERQQERDYADMGPYRAMGTGALSRLAFGVGIPDPNAGGSRSGSTLSALGGTQAPSASPVQDMNISPMQQTPATAANVSGGGMVTVRTPFNTTVMVPAAKVQEAIANGGTVLSGAA